MPLQLKGAAIIVFVVAAVYSYLNAYRQQKEYKITDAKDAEPRAVYLRSDGTTDDPGKHLWYKAQSHRHARQSYTWIGAFCLAMANWILWCW